MSAVKMLAIFAFNFNMYSTVISSFLFDESLQTIYGQPILR